MHKSFCYYAAAAGTTGIAGILHLQLASAIIDGRGLNSFGIFFIIAGIAQLFWVVPMIKRWGRPWYYGGIGGTAILLIIWAVTRVPNPITGGRALSINPMSIVTELFEYAFIIITVILVARERKMHVSQKDSLR
jgi:hypothetical protein